MQESTDPKRKRLRSRFGGIPRVARNIGVVLGVIAAVISIVIPLKELAGHQKQLALEQKRANDDAENANRVLKVTSLLGIIEVLDRDIKIKSQIQKFLVDYPDTERVMSKVKDFDTGRAAYFSTEFGDLCAVGHHYETLGALARRVM
jgi:hypothetical protein